MATPDQIPYYDEPVEKRGPGTSDPLGISPLTLIKHAPAGPDDPLGIYPLRVIDKSKKGAASLGDLKKEAARRKPAAAAAIKLPQGYKLDAPATAPSAAAQSPAAASATTRQSGQRSGMFDTSNVPGAIPGMGRPRAELPAVGATQDDQVNTSVGDMVNRLADDRRELTALRHSVGITSLPEKLQQFREHPVETAAEMIPAYAVGRGLYQEGKRVVGELGEAAKAATTSGVSAPERAAAVASHVTSAVPIVGGLKDVALDEDLKAGGEPVSLTEDFTDPKKYLKNLKIAASSPEVRGTAEGAAAQAALLFDALQGSFANRANALEPEYLPPRADRALSAPAEPPTVRGQTIRPTAIGPGGEPATPRAALPAPTEGLTPAEQEVEQAIDDRLAQHPKTEAEVRADLQEIAPENRQAVLDAINQQGIEAYQRGDKAAAMEAAHHAWILKGIIEADARAARAARIAARPAETAPVAPPAPTTPARSSDPRLAPAATGEEEPPQTSLFEPEAGTPETPAAATPRRAARPVATAEPEPEQGTLFGEPETPAPLVPRETAAPPEAAPTEEAPTEEAPATVGQAAEQIAKTMTRQQILDELGVKKGSGDSRLRSQTKRLALALAMKRAAAAPPPAAAKKKPKVAPAPEPAPPPAAPAPAAAPPAPKTAKKKAKTAADEVADFYAPGNVIYDKYWNAYDKVLNFRPSADGGRWQVQVIHSDKDGNPIPGEQPRWHSTYPDPGDKVVSRAPQAAPESPEKSSTGESQPGLVGQVAEQIGKRKKKPKAVPPAPEPAPPPAAAAEPINRAADLAQQMAEMRKTKPSSIAKRFGKNGPTPEQRAAYEGEVRAWNREYSRLSREQKKALEEDNKKFLEEQGLPAEEPVTAAPAASPATPVTAPTRAAGPKEAAASGPVTTERIAGSSPPTWQVPGTDYHVRLVNDNFDIFKGSDHVGDAPSLDEAKTQIQAHMAAPEVAPAKPAPVNEEALKKSWTEAVARPLAQNQTQAVGSRSEHRGVPVIVANDDAMVMLNRMAGHRPVSNGVILTPARAAQVHAALRELAANDPENRRALTEFADHLVNVQTQNGNVVLHRAGMGAPEIARVALEELFHDFQYLHKLVSLAKGIQIHRAMKAGPSGELWQKVGQHLWDNYGYKTGVIPIEIPAWIAAGYGTRAPELQSPLERTLGITPEDASKLLVNYFKAVENIVEKPVTPPPMAEGLEPGVHDAIRRRDIGGPAKDISGGRGGRVDTLQPAERALPDKGPRARKPAAETGRELQSRQPAPLAELKAEAEERDPSREPAPVWYLKSNRVIADKMKGPMAGPDVLRMLQNNGISPDELKWTGLDDYLPTAGRVTPDQLKNFISDNAIQIKEVGLGATEEAAKKEKLQGQFNRIGEEFYPRLGNEETDVYFDDLDDAILAGRTEEVIQRLPADLQGKAREWARLREQERKISDNRREPKYASYQEPGGENYRELLLTLPARQEPMAYPEPLTELPEGYSIARDRTRQGAQYAAIPPGQIHGRPLDGRHYDTPEKAREAALKFVNQQRNSDYASDWSKRNERAKFTASHWDEPNVLAHVRMNDRTTPDGKRLLHLEEIQSDWHQKGRREGYTSPEDAKQIAYLRDKVALLKEETATYFREYKDAIELHGLDKPETRAPYQDWEGSKNRLAHAEHELRALNRSDKIPDAPFKKNWQEMTLRRMIRYAAENGYDGISWTGGEKQAERYDLSKQISRVVYDPASQHIYAYDHAGKEVVREEAEVKDLPNYIGKDATDKLIPQIEEFQHDTSVDIEPRWDEDEQAYVLYDGNGDPMHDPYSGGVEKYDNMRDVEAALRYHRDGAISKVPFPTLRGLDLKVGGEGMHGFYDKIIPDYLNKFGKKFGARVEKTETGGASMNEVAELESDLRSKDERFRRLYNELRDLEPSRRSSPLHEHEYVHKQTEVRKALVDKDEALDKYKESLTRPELTAQYLPITDAMRDAALGEGMTLFSKQPVREVDIPESARRPIKSFVSPNTTNLENVGEAQDALAGEPQRLMQQESDWLLNELGAKVKSRKALGIWEDGAENTVLHEFPRDTDHDLVTYHNATLAKAGWQKFMLNFFPHPEGDDILFRVKFPKEAGTPDEISQVLAKQGIKASTIISERDGHAVVIATTGKDQKETLLAVNKAVEQLGGEDGAELVTTRGRSEYVGKDDRDAAGRLFTRIINEREALHPEWRAIRSRLESRPGFNELRRLVREGSDNGPVALDYLKDEAARRKPIDPGVDPDEVVLNRKNNLNWDDIKKYLLPVEREAYEKKPELQRKIVAAVNMMPNVDEWDAAVKAGAVGRLWYERSARAFDGLISAMPESFQPKDKKKFLNFVSALSPVQTVRLNLMMAIDLWDKWNKAGRPMDVQWENEKTHTGVADKSAKLYRLMAGMEKEEIPQEERGLFGGKGRGPKKRQMRGVDLESRLYNAIRALQGQPLSGPKVSAFAPNLGENIDKSTNDTWMAVFADTDPNTINQKHLYDAVSAHVRMAAEKNDIPTRQAQAAIWSFIKSLAELSGWGANRWIPPQEIIDRNILTPDSVESKSWDFADLMLHDYGIRAKLSKIGADLNVLDRKLKRIVPEKPAVKPGSIADIAERLSGAARRLEAVRGNDRINRHLERKTESRQGGFFPPPEESPIRRAISLERAKAEAAERRPH